MFIEILIYIFRFTHRIDLLRKLSRTGIFQNISKKKRNKKRKGFILKAKNKKTLFKETL